MAHTCPAPGCDQQVPFDRLTCPRHWYGIPKPLRDRLWKAWREDDLDEHTRAREEIVQFLQQDAAA